MRIRIRPAEVEVPEDEPFKNDLLNRKELADVLTQLVDSVEGSCVLTVDAAWGAGKTTFLRMWSQHLRKNGFPAVAFNAWETDHAEDPFVALVSEITDGLKEALQQERLSQHIRDTIDSVKKVALRAMPAAIRILTAGILDVEPLIEKEAGKLLSSLAESRLAKYHEAQDSIQEFRSKLEEMSSTLVESLGHPLIVMVDELDRCRPSYAVQLIESAKHLFGVDHVIFVLSLNRDQIVHSIKALYGCGFDATGYLRRFFDIDFRLPEPDRDQFIGALLDGIEIPENAHDIVRVFFGLPNLSLRHVGQAIHRLRIVLASARGKDDLLICGAVAALVLRTIDPDMYWELVRGVTTDKRVIDSMFRRVGITAREDEDTRKKHACILFEATIAMGWNEISNGDHPRKRDQEIDTPLLVHYRQLLEAAPSDELDRSDVRYAEEVIALISGYAKDVRYPFGRPVKFVDAVGRMELVAPFDERT